MFRRYRIYCWEQGSTLADPYDQDDSFDIARIVCESMADATDCRWYIYDMIKGCEVFVKIGATKWTD